uniref:Sorting nexin 20 n=1 Tax=Buteo japonicus TaxID=224669 RepID=A0A8C0BAX1_9AVES
HQAVILPFICSHSPPLTEYSNASLSPNSSMTTKELQEYWRNEKRQCRQVKLLFEIPSTRIVEHHLSKYVMYKIIILQTGSFDSNKSVIERRYSDFEKLHRNLLEEFNPVRVFTLKELAVREYVQ